MAKRRSNGEGSIRKRKDGRWEGRYTAGHDPATGKQIFKSVLGKTQAEVKEKLKKAIEENKDIDIIKAEEYTVGQWMDVWYETYCIIKVRRSSHQTYRGYIDNHIKPYIGSIKLNKLTTLDLQRLYGKLLKSGRIVRPEMVKDNSGLSPKSVRNVHNVISAAMDKAKVEKLISRNPADDCVLPERQHIEMQTLAADELRAFFQEAKKSGLFEFYYTDLSTGLRRGEILGLKWTDIDFEEQTIRVRRQILRLEGEVQEAPLKTKNAYRTISISRELAEILKEKQKKEKGFSVYVFPSPVTGGPRSPDALRSTLLRILERAGLQRIRFHDLRHTFATLALQNGVDIKTVSGMLGHYSAGFTLDTYAHVTTAAQRDAAKKMGNLLNAAI